MYIGLAAYVIISLYSLFIFMVTPIGDTRFPLYDDPLWDYGHFISVVSSWPASFSLVFVSVLIIINTKFGSNGPKITNKQKIAIMGKKNKELALQLRIANITINQKIDKLVKQDAILQYTKNKMCPNCLAEVEEYLKQR